MDSYITDGCCSETRSQSIGCTSDAKFPPPFAGDQWESLGTPRSPRTESLSTPRSPRTSTGSTAGTRSQRLGKEFTAELWNTHLLQEAIGETINLDRKHIAARANIGISPAFRKTAQRPPSREDPARRLIDSMIEDSINHSLRSSCGSKPSSRASSYQIQPGIRNLTDTSLDLSTISLGIHSLNDLARKRKSTSPPRSKASSPRSQVSENAKGCASTLSSPRSVSLSFKWADAKRPDNTSTWPEPKELVAMVEEDADSCYKNVQRTKSPRGASLQVLPSIPDNNKNFVEVAKRSPRQSPNHSPRNSPRSAFSRASSCSSPSMTVESVTLSNSWKAHRDQDRDSAFRRSLDDVRKAVETVATAQNMKSRSASKARVAPETPPTKNSKGASITNTHSSRKTSEACAAPEPPNKLSTETGAAMKLASTPVEVRSRNTVAEVGSDPLSLQRRVDQLQTQMERLNHENQLLREEFRGRRSASSPLRVCGLSAADAVSGDVPPAVVNASVTQVNCPTILAFAELGQVKQAIADEERIGAEKLGLGRCNDGAPPGHHVLTEDERREILGILGWSTQANKGGSRCAVAAHVRAC